METTTPTKTRPQAPERTVDRRIDRLSTASLKCIVEPDTEVRGEVGNGQALPRRAPHPGQRPGALRQADPPTDSLADSPNRAARPSVSPHMRPRAIVTAFAIVLAAATAYAVPAGASTATRAGSTRSAHVAFGSCNAQDIVL